MSSRIHLNNAISALYEVVEVNNIGGIPSSVATEALRLVNPALAPDHAAALVAEADTRGRQQLTREDFIHAVSLCLQNTELSDAVRVTKDLVLRMRTTYRRRYLMYDALPNTPAPALLDNAKLVSTFRELFDLVSNGAETITRTQLRLIVQDVLPDFSTDATNIVKAALGEGEDDAIGFYEFMMVMQPATSRRALSDMVRMAKARRAGDANDGSLGAKSVTASNGGGTSTPSNATAGAVGVRMPAQHNALRSELEQYRQLNAAMEQKFKAVIGTPVINTSSFSATTARAAATPTPAKDHFQSVAEAEIAALKVQNEELRHQITVLESSKGMPESSSGRSPSRSVGAGQRPSQGLPPDAEQRIADLEKELRLTRSQLAVAQESTKLAAAMRDIPASAVAKVAREHGADENALIAKQKYLREIMSSIHDQESPVYTVVTQYDLLVTMYQAMYRETRGKLEATKRKPFDAAAAAKQIIPASNVVVPSGGLHRGHSVLSAAPMSWSEIDRPADAEMRHTRMLSDPLLTLEERNVLRAKLASQMRGAARHYRSPSVGRPRSASSLRAADEIETVVSSRDAMQKLQQLSAWAHREQRL
jgi:hypothetical protein